jgi:hypothetical protein
MCRLFSCFRPKENNGRSSPRIPRSILLIECILFTFLSPDAVALVSKLRA